MQPEWAAMAMFLATVGLVLVSVGAALISYFLLRSQVDPHVIVYVWHDESRPSILTIVIENIGEGTAHDVQFSLSREIPQRATGLSPGKGDEGQADFEPMSRGPLVTGIPLLAPKDKRVLTWGQYGGLVDTVGTSPVRESAHFTSRHLFPWDPTDHTIDSLLEVVSYEATDASQGPKLRQARAVEKIAKSFDRIRHSMDGIGRAIRELGEMLEERDQEDDK